VCWYRVCQKLLALCSSDTSYRAASLNDVIIKAVTLCIHEYVVWMVDSFISYLNCMWTSLSVLQATWNKSVEMSELLEVFRYVRGSRTLLVKYPLSFVMTHHIWCPETESSLHSKVYLVCMTYSYRAVLLFRTDGGWLSWDYLLLFYVSGSRHLIWVSSVTSTLSSTVEGRDDCCFTVQHKFSFTVINFVFRVKYIRISNMPPSFLL